MALNKIAGLVTTPRWLIVTLSCVIAALLAGGAWFYQSQLTQAREEVERSLDSIAQLKVEQIANWRAERLADAYLFMESPYIYESINRWLETKDPGEAEKLLARFKSTVKHEHYKDVMLVDFSGRIILSVSGRQGLLHEETLRDMAEALRDRKARLTDIHTGPQDRPPHIDLIAPMYFPGKDGTEQAKALIFQADAGSFLFPFVQSWPVRSSSAETVLVRREGDSVRFLNELRHVKDTSLKLRIPVTKNKVPAVMAAMGREGVLEGSDYRDVEVLSASKKVPESPWYLVAKIDKDEAYAGLRTRSFLILGCVLALMLAAVAMAGFVWQRGMKAQYRDRVRADEQRQESEKRYGVTLMSIGDGVVVTDREGRITILNPVAEQLTGWTLADALGKPLGEVFKIINEESRKSVENPVVRVFSEGGIVGLANHTLLVSRDGREIPIMDSGAPIRNEAGEINGAVLVFRDQSADREAQSALKSSEELYHSLFNNLLNGYALCRMIYDDKGQPDDFLYLDVNKAFEKQTGLKNVVGRKASEAIPGIREADPGLIKKYGRVAKTGEPDWFEIYVAALDDWYHISVYSPQKDHFVAVFDVITERKRAEEELRESENKFRNVFEASNVGKSLTLPSGEVVPNKALCDLLGYTSEELSKKTWQEITPPEDIEATGRILASLMNGEKDFARFNKRYLHKDGSIIWADLYVAIHRGKDGKPANFISTVVDITEQKRAEDLLKASEQQYRALVDSSQEMIVLHELVEDKNGKAVDYRILDCNPAFTRVTGIPREKAVGALASGLYGTGLAPYLENYAPVAKTGVPARFETYFTGMDKYFRISVYSPSPGRFATMSADVTDRRRAEDALKDSEEQFRAIFENNSAAIAIIEPDTTISMVNDAYCAMGGFEREEVVGTSWTRQIPQDDLERLKEYNRRRLENPKAAPTTYEFKFYHRSGEVRHAQMSVSLIPTSRRIVAAFIDFTERRRAEVALKESEGKYRSLVDQAGDSIILHDANGRILDANRKTCESLGYTRDELLALSIKDIDPQAIQAGKNDVWRKVIDGEQARFESRQIRKDGSAIPVEVTLGSVGLSGGRAILGIIRDITERQRLQEQLLQSQKMESIGRLAGGIAHDFNNLLTGIMGNLSLALDEMDERDPLRDPLEDLGRAAESAAALTRQLLAFSRKQIVEPKVLNVNEIILQSQKMLVRLLGEDVELKADLAGDLGNVRVDPAQIEQIIVNLAVNARDAMPDGGTLTLETSNVALGEDYNSRHPDAGPGNYVMIAVSDNGTGMSAEVKAHLFEPFFTTKEKGKGTGLGLSTVFGAVKQNNGNIDVYSEAGQGTVFKIYLPRVYETVERAVRPSGDEMPTGSETVILVEDEDIVRGYAEKVLKKAGYSVHSFSNGGEAIAFAGKSAEPIHMLVTDVIMPGINGRVLAQNLRGIVPGLKVLFSSGYTENVIAHHGVLDKGIAFIGKPYTPQALARKVREVLDAG